MKTDYTTSNHNDHLNINPIGNDSSIEIHYRYGQKFVDALPSHSYVELPVTIVTHLEAHNCIYAVALQFLLNGTKSRKPVPAMTMLQCTKQGP